MAKPLTAGGEVDSWCTKCKLILNHRIIAMVGKIPATVECSTCSSHHKYRARAPGEKAVKAASATGGTATKSARPPRGPKASEVAAREREQMWEKYVNGRSPNDFAVYKPAGMFSEGDLLRHTKFGDGVVTRVVDVRKIEVLFRDEPRMLAQNYSD